MTSVAFIGLGVMGAPMAGHLIRNGHEVAVFDVSEQAMRPFAAMDCRRAASAAEAADGADVVMTILPDITHVRSALLDKGGATETLAPGGLVVEMSTIGAAASLALAGDLKARGFRMVDAPVGRPPSAARDGNLLVMAGGEAKDVGAARPLFDCFADTVVHVGPQGSGIKLKLVNNYMAMVGMAMTAETLALADAVGLDRKLTVDVLRTTAAGRGQINVNFPTKVLAGDVTPDFPLRMGLRTSATPSTWARRGMCRCRWVPRRGSISAWRRRGDARSRTARPCSCSWRTSRAWSRRAASL